jgi:diguanylate cyclase (GGDEF)-like protein
MEGRAGILMVGDSLHDQKIHAVTLQNRGYDVITAGDLEETLAVLEGQTPDLILIEAHTRGQDGFAIGNRIKLQDKMANIPIIFITDGRTPEVVDRVYAAGGVDFIQKPCSLGEFLARIETQIHLHNLLIKVEQLKAIAIDSNPLTHLPGNNTIVMTIQEAIKERADVALIYTDLDNFKSYNDVYGFSAGDDVLLYNANTLQDVLRQVCGEEGFLGHIGGDDFVMMFPAGCLNEVGEKVVAAFDEGVPEFYNEVDRERGYIMAEDRTGELRKHPLVSISLAGILLRQHDFGRYVEVAAVCAELKKEAKSRLGSNLFIDRRKGVTV